MEQLPARIYSIRCLPWPSNAQAGSSVGRNQPMLITTNGIQHRYVDLADSTWNMVPACICNAKYAMFIIVFGAVPVLPPLWEACTYIRLPSVRSKLGTRLPKQSPLHHQTIVLSRHIYPRRRLPSKPGGCKLETLSLPDSPSILHHTSHQQNGWCRNAQSE